MKKMIRAKSKELRGYFKKIILLLFLPFLLYSQENNSSFTNSIGIKFVYIPKGEFILGSKNPSLPTDEKPTKRVKIKPFYIATTEVTQKQWKRVMNYNPSFFKADNNPVENITFEEAKKFVYQLNKLEKRNNYALPTEIEWEYVAKEKIDNLDRVAWYYNNSENRTHKVATKKANRFGIYDMLGNVWEWCNSAYTSSYKKGEKKEKNFVLRGGAFNTLSFSTRPSFRMKNNPSIKRFDNGFRLIYIPHKLRCGIDYQLKFGDTLGEIAKKAYGNNSRWDILYYFNINKLLGKKELPIGKKIYIPCLNEYDLKAFKPFKEKREGGLKFLAEYDFPPFVAPKSTFGGMALHITKEVLKELKMPYSIHWVDFIDILPTNKFGGFWLYNGNWTIMTSYISYAKGRCPNLIEKL